MRKLYLLFFAALMLSLSACGPQKEKAFDHVDYGRLLHSGGNYQQAIVEFDKAIDYWEDFHEAYFYRGCAYAGLKMYDKAIEDLTYATKIKPDYGDAYYSRGVIYSMLNKKDEACTDYESAKKCGVNAAKEKLRFCK